MTPHQVDLDEMLAWITDKHAAAITYACSTAECKAIDVVLAGGYIVRHGKQVVYDGTDGRTAVNTYNAIASKPTTD